MISLPDAMLNQVSKMIDNLKAIIKRNRKGELRLVIKGLTREHYDRFTLERGETQFKPEGKIFKSIILE